MHRINDCFNILVNCVIVGESGEDESSDSKSDSSDSSESSSTGVAKVCQEGLVCTPVGNGKSECRPAPTIGMFFRDH